MCWTKELVIEEFKSYMPKDVVIQGSANCKGSREDSYY